MDSAAGNSKLYYETKLKPHNTKNIAWKAQHSLKKTKGRLLGHKLYSHLVSLTFLLAENGTHFDRIPKVSSTYLLRMLSSSDQYDDTKVVRDAILRIYLLLSLYQNKSIPTKKNVGLALSLGHEQAFSLIKPLKKASLL